VARSLRFLQGAGAPAYHLSGIMLTERKRRKNDRAPHVAVSLSAGALPFAFEG
jgi:hypothetical protein